VDIWSAACLVSRLDYAVVRHSADCGSSSSC
jgi:hypothetical protein